jgi:hypothetical protein
VAEIRTAVPSWPAEQPQDDGDALTEAHDALEQLTRELAEIAEQRTRYREEIMRLRARAREQDAAEQPQDVRDGEGAAGQIARFLTHFREDSDDTVIEGLGRYRLTVGMLRAVLAEREQLRPEFGIRTTRISTEISEEPVSDNLDDALALIAAAEAKGRPGVLSREPVQREVSEWHGIGNTTAQQPEDGDRG